MRIAISQINFIVGDLRGNSAKILEHATRARSAGAALLVTSELGLCGYPPEDLILRDGFVRDCDGALQELAGRCRDIAVLVGHPVLLQGKRYNAVSLLYEGRVAATGYKMRLPNDSVFDEQRYFEPGTEPLVFELGGVHFGVPICQDIWERGPAEAACARGAQVLIVPNGSPYHMQKQSTRYDVVGEAIGKVAVPVIYCNQVGGQDELVFDGASFAMDAQRNVRLQMPAFVDAQALVELGEGRELRPGELVPELSLEQSVYAALTLGVRDYVNKNGFPGVLLGLSGGIDSALTLAIAVDALGADKVQAVMMPSQFNLPISLEDSQVMVDKLGVRAGVLPIKPVYDSFLATLQDEFRGRAFDTTEENIQARIRGTLLMALSNKYGSIVLTTGNKSEMAVGYCTLYGDMAGGFAVLKDIFKTLVYRLARYRNTISPVIPERVITRAPSAELRENQTDQDSLPPYDVLDAIVARYMEQNQSPEEIVRQGYAEADVKRVVRLIKINEYKRRQAPVGVRISERAFGKDWRYPITSKYSA